MMTVHEVSRISGVSIRTLHHYDHIGLLPATSVTEAGYRLYDETALERLQCILLFRELEFPLREIKEILDCRGFDRNKALEQQIHLLELRREHLKKLIDLAREMQMKEGNPMNFDAFDTAKIDEYARQAKEFWGTTAEYVECEQKMQHRTQTQQKEINAGLMEIFAEFGKMKDLSPESPEAMAQAEKLQNYITENYYHCSDQVLYSLGDMYAAGGDFTANIDRAGGAGTAAFARNAIHAMIRIRKDR